MSYQHMFYGVDLDRLKAIYGSGDEKLLAEVIQKSGEELEGNDGLFEDEIEAGDCPNSETALRNIFAGKIEASEENAALYGYVLKILCEHLGTSIGEDDVAVVRDHPYQSKLVANGPPLPIPYDSTDFPEIGYLSLQEIPEEIKRIDAAPKKAKRTFQSAVVLPVLGWMLSFLMKGFKFRQMDDATTVEDMNAYRNTLQAALDKRLAVVSFRH
ncbi:MAG: hypothetical protein JWN70_6060 [Planctomycetaceae bacterium]|nr:hypothetical protein [Planctomycetaceae bacterium]